MRSKQLHHKHIAVGFLAALLAGAGLGFYLGYDFGWEAAVAYLNSI